MDKVNKGLMLSKLIRETAMLFKHSMMKGFEDIGITAPQRMVLGVLGRYGQMKITDLSEKLSLSNSTVSGIVDRLEKQQFVERIRSEEDRRVVFVKISPKFESMHNDFISKSDKNVENITSKATEEELDKIIEGLNILKGLLENYNKQ